MKVEANTLPEDVTGLKGIITEQFLKIQKYEEKVNYHREEVSERDEKIVHQQEKIALHREELQRQQEEVVRHREEVVKQQAELARVKSENERLEEIIRLLRHRHFGCKSEHVKGEDDLKQLGIFNEAEESIKEEREDDDESPSIEVKSHRRRGTPKRIKLPADLPREDVVIDLKEEEKVCPEGHRLECIGEDISEQLDVIPAQIKVIRTIRKKYACKCCEGHVKRAELPKTAIPKSMAGAGLLAHIATSKYGDGLPLYRQEHIWQRIGIDIPRATMASWMIKVGELLTPVLNLMEEELLDSGYVQADETRVQVLKEGGKLAESLSYMWVRSGSINSPHGRNGPKVKPITIFEYDPSRSGDVAEELFAGYQGYLQADGYAGYNEVCSWKGITRLGCWAHCRRKFFEASKASKKGVGLANEAIEMIRKLYEIEETIKDKKIEERHRTRNERSEPVLNEFRKWLDEHRGKILPQSQLGKALNYAHNEWPYLVRYIDDGRLNIDNNMVENAIRPFAIGRKNWLFSDSVAGAKASAAIYSVIISARQNGHNEYAYLKYLLERLPLAEELEDFEGLLPHKLLPEDIPANSTPKIATPLDAVR